MYWGRSRPNRIRMFHSWTSIPVSWCHSACGAFSCLVLLLWSLPLKTSRDNYIAQVSACVPQAVLRTPQNALPLEVAWVFPQKQSQPSKKRLVPAAASGGIFVPDLSAPEPIPGPETPLAREVPRRLAKGALGKEKWSDPDRKSIQGVVFFKGIPR